MMSCLVNSNSRNGILTALCLSFLGVTFAWGLRASLAQEQQVDCVGKPYGTPGCPLKKSQTSSAPATCGNGILDDAEECDYGKTRNGFSNCTTGCVLLYCGDGIVSPGNDEECEPEREERYVRNPDTGELEVEQRYLQPTCGSICTVPVCDFSGSCNGGCKRKFLPACQQSSQQGAVIPGPKPSTGGGTSTPAAPAPTTARCGDGIMQPGEECDDANKSDIDNCTNACRSPVCGDGIVQSWEQCDDSNRVDGDACSNSCKSPACGDGIAQSGEECDDGNHVSNDSCTNACKAPRCGDGILQGVEECDDGNSAESDACTNSCGRPRCGDGIVQSGEECDDGNVSNDDSCTTQCKAPRCGDGIVQAGEECDDGNKNTADACNNLCNMPVCGNGIKEGVEGCDDGNRLDGDACTNACSLPRCGDGILQSAEECDDGNTVNDDACTNSCRVLRCGDGILQAGEECDDGRANSNTDADVCRKNCRLPRCGDGVIDKDEECDFAAALEPGKEGESCSRQCKTVHAAAPESPLSRGGMLVLAGLGLLGVIAASSAWYFRRRIGKVVRVSGKRGSGVNAGAIDDIPLDEIEMPWHRWQ